jgi:outer membrane immunogenic protein
MTSIKKILVPLILALTGATQVQASEFTGAYVGAKAGFNWSDSTGHTYQSTHATAFPGLTIGYNYDLAPVVVGIEGFADFHGGSTTKKDAGIDAKVGMPISNVMPYARVGLTGTWPDTRLHYGAGVEYKVAKQWSVAGEWTADRAHYEGGHRQNNSLTVGVHYYFF